MIISKHLLGSSIGIDNELREDNTLYVDIYDRTNNIKSGIKLQMQHIILLHDHLDTIIKKYNESKTICISPP